MSETCIRFGEIGARVMIEDKEVQHYAMHVDPAKKEVSCWIASEEGKAFSVVWLEFNFKYPSAGLLYFDGQPAASLQRDARDAASETFRYITISESSRVPFLFSPLVVTDDDTYLDTSHSIGEIKLVIERTTVPKVVAKKKRTYISPPHVQKVHERSKKAIAHRVNYGSEIPSLATRTYSSKSIEILATFIFKYRPLEMLRANDIVPRNPEPLEPQEHAPDARSTSETSSGKGEHFKVEKEVESGSEDEDSDSMREKALLAEAERIRTEVEKIRKGKHLKDSKRPKKKLKKEDKPLFMPGEVIDLT